MKRLAKNVSVFIFIFFTLMANNNVQAKIAAPKDVEPLVYEDIKFTAPHEHYGFIEAWNNNTGEKLWELQVYKKNINPILEEDVQWVFITKLEMENNRLIVINSKSEKYLVDIEQKKVESSATTASYWWYIFIGIIILAVSTLFIYFIIKKKNYIR